MFSRLLPGRAATTEGGCKQSRTQQIPCNGSEMTQLTQRVQTSLL